MKKEERDSEEEKINERMSSEEKDQFNNNINSLPSFRTSGNFLTVSNNNMSRRRNSLANGQIQLGLIPRIKVSLAPELKSSRGPDEELHPPIDEHSEQDLRTGRGVLDLPKNKSFFRRNSLPDSEYLRKRSNSTSISPFIVESKRRISQVSNVVTQHFQSTIGWSLKSHSEIARQSRCLAAKYIRWKLRKNGLFHKRLQLQRLRSVGNLIDEHDVYINEIAIELKCLIQELDRNHPKLFSSVIAHAGDVMLKNVHALKRVHRLIGQFIFESSSNQSVNNGSDSNQNQSCQYNWSQVAAFYAVTGALAVDSVRSGHPEYVLPLIDSLTRFISKQVAPWISQEGGWVSE